MSVRRAKACDKCRTAKARCSLTTPCSRCAKRHLECHYAAAQPRSAGNRGLESFRPIRPAGGVSLVAEAVTPTGAAASGVDVPPEETEMNALVAAATGPQMQDPTVYSDFTPQLFDLPESFDLSLEVAPASHSSQSFGHVPAHPSFSDLMSSSYLLNLDLPAATPRFMVPSLAERRFHTFDKPGLLTAPNPTDSASSTKEIGPQLSQRTRSLQQGSLTAKMLFGRLTDYTRMMADGKQLPPFIHPPCCLDGRDDDCHPDSPHRCLAETLAVCANLTQMFYSRMPGSQGFVWQQICTHLRQMHGEVSCRFNPTRAEFVEC